jgi:hypothetical protein
MGDTQLLYCSCGAARQVPLKLAHVSCIQCGGAMAPASIARIAPAPSRGVAATATFVTQLLGTFVFALAVYSFVVLQRQEPFVIGLLAAGAFGVFAGGRAHRGSVNALCSCIAYDLALAVAVLSRIPEVNTFVTAPLQRLTLARVPTLTTLGAVALVTAAACIAALPQVRRFAAWRGSRVMQAVRARG